MKIARRRLFGLVAAIAAVGTVKPAQAATQATQAAPLVSTGPATWVQVGSANIPAFAITSTKFINSAATTTTIFSPTSAGHYVGNGQAERSLPVPPNAKMLMIAPGWDGKGWA